MEDAAEIALQLRAFGGALRRARVARHITQEGLAERADLNLRTVQRIEAGQTNILITTALRLRRGIGCPWGELLPEGPCGESAGNVQRVKRG
jgi:transcriptional regulator with XRE-family HTH domain